MKSPTSFRLAISLVIVAKNYWGSFGIVLAIFNRDVILENILRSRLFHIDACCTQNFPLAYNSCMPEKCSRNIANKVYRQCPRFVSKIMVRCCAGACLVFFPHQSDIQFSIAQMKCGIFTKPGSSNNLHVRPK